MVKVIIFFLFIIIAASIFVGYMVALMGKQNYDIKLKIKVDNKGNIYFLKQYLIRGFVFKTETVARYSVEKNEFQVY